MWTIEAPERAIAAAERIGQAIRERAIPQGDASTWQVRDTFQSTRQRRPVSVEAGGGLYGGTAGIGLFLGELAATTFCPQTAACAEAAMRHALAWARDRPSWSIGFHEGLTGVMWAALRVGSLLNNSELLDGGFAILERCRRSERTGAGDVIAGEAGAIPAALSINQMHQVVEARSWALEMAERVTSSAERGAFGWSWERMRNCVRPLAGYAHGVSGFVHALAEVAAETGDAGLLYAVNRGLAYERGAWQAALRNWSDYRHTALFEYEGDDREARMRADLRRGAVLSWPRTHSMWAWCHGAPGIGLARVRMYALALPLDITNDIRDVWT